MNCEQDPSGLFEALFEQAREAVLVADAGTLLVVRANPSAQHLLGFNEEELRAVSLPELSLDTNRDLLVSFIEESRDRARPATLTTRLRGQGFESIPCDLSIRLLKRASPPLLLVTFQDLSERIRAMEDIELRNIAIANVQSGVTIADARQPDLPLIYVNRGFQQITGYSAREAVGRSCRFLQGEDREQPSLEELREALREGQPCVVQLRNYRKDGKLFYNELHISPVHNETGELTHFVGIQLDVTEQVQARESLERSERRYRQALAREQELNEIKTRFISMVSHEFRTPMTGMQASAALLRRLGDRLTLEKQHQHLENIENALRRMNRLLDDVLFFSRAESRKLKVSRKETHLPDHLAAVIETLNPIYPDRRVELDTSGLKHPVQPLDTHLLDHILHNLLGNALKYSPVTTPVTCHISEDADGLSFSITDQGIGIPEADQKKLFEAFHRAGNVGTRQGTGLGLNIALRAVELLEGTLTFTSQQDSGSTFTVHLPHPSGKTQSP